MATAELIRAPRVQARRLSRSARVYALLWATTALAAILVSCVPPLHQLAEALLDLDLSPHARASAANVLRLVAANAWMAWPLVVALLGGARMGWSRTLTDLALVGDLALNAALVGAALGLHGRALVPWLPHLPLEWAALAVSAGGWLGARSGAIAGRALASRLAFFLALLLVAGALETYAVPHP